MQMLVPPRAPGRACIVATQTANEAARALYERCGGIAIETVNDFHFWMGKEGSKPNDPMSDIPNNKPYLGTQELKNVEARTLQRAHQMPAQSPH